MGTVCGTESQPARGQTKVEVYQPSNRPDVQPAVGPSAPPNVPVEVPISKPAFVDTEANRSVAASRTISAAIPVPETGLGHMTPVKNVTPKLRRGSRHLKLHRSSVHLTANELQIIVSGRVGSVDTKVILASVFHMFFTARIVCCWIDRLLTTSLSNKRYLFLRYRINFHLLIVPNRVCFRAIFRFRNSPSENLYQKIESSIFIGQN